MGTRCGISVASMAQDGLLITCISVASMAQDGLLITFVRSPIRRRCVLSSVSSFSRCACCSRLSDDFCVSHFGL
jgi:hypothetical protein